MRIQLVHNHFSAEHLAAVIEQMKTLGAPEIHAVWNACADQWVALEGSHRIRAAKKLGLAPVIIEVEYSDADVEDVVPGQFQDALTVAQAFDSCNAAVIEF